MKIFRCPKCLAYIDHKYINKHRKEGKSWLTKFQCQNCGVNLRQTWLTLIYAWLVFGFMAYSALFIEGSWLLVYGLPVAFFIVLLALAWLGQIFIENNDKNE